MLTGVGSLVISTNGRDKNNYFLVVKIENDYVYLCDGNIRKVDNPKKKKLKHVQVTKYFLEELSKKIQQNKKITNKEVQVEIEQITKRR